MRFCSTCIYGVPTVRQALPCPRDAVVTASQGEGEATGHSSDVLLSILLAIIPLLLARTLGTASGIG